MSNHLPESASIPAGLGVEDVNVELVRETNQAVV
jgi:hypothetical protein